MSLSASSTVSQWLDHPVGGPIFRAMLEQGGASAEALAPARNLRLEQLVAMSEGKFPTSMVEALVAAYRDATPDGEGAEPDAGPATWQEETVPGRFAGQTVVITGAGSGIGRAVASRVVREGGRVVAVDLAADRLDDLVASLGAGQVVPVAGDITVQETVDRIIEAAGARVHALANVAGITDDNSAVHEVSDEMWRRVLSVNLDGTMRLTRAVVPGMLAAGEGSVVNISSEAGLRGSAAGVAYTVSKHAVIGLTKSCAVMYAGTGVRVNAVAPGGVMTGIPVPPNAEFGGTRLAAFRGNIPGLATAEELAASISFLLSKDSVNLNGVVLASDGGWSAV